MRLISSLSWVQKGVSQTPQKVCLSKDEMKSLFSELDANKNANEDDDDDEEEAEDKEEEEAESGSSKNEEAIERKYNLEKYDEEDDDLRLESLNSLACFPSNQEDALLTRKDDGEDSDQEDLAIEPTDNLIVCGTIDQDDSSLDIYVYNEENAQFYIHHDVLLSSMPVCLEWLNFNPNNDDSTVNLVAVGSMDPWIEIWDLNIMDSLEADFVLGDVNAKKKLKKIKKMEDVEEKKRARRKIRGHTDSVVCMSSNLVEKSELASGSADKTVLVWDLNTMKPKCKKIKCHTDRIQSIRFHPDEQSTLLSGAADKTVLVHDCRSASWNTWKFKNEIEKVVWNWHESDYFLCSDDSGKIHLNDRRVEGKKLCSVKVNDEDAPAVLSLSRIVPGLLVTGCEENDLVKVWDLDYQKASIELVAEKKFKLGSINCLESSPDSGFVFAFGGIKSTSPLVWVTFLLDLREMKEIRTRFYPRLGIEEENEEKEAEKQKEDRIAKRKARALKFKEIKTSREQNFSNRDSQSSSNFRQHKRPNFNSNYNNNSQNKNANTFKSKPFKNNK